MTVRDVIHISAPPEVVWAVTEDIERWPEWTPTVTSATRFDAGPLKVGSSARIKQPGLSGRWVVTSLERGRRFTWETRRMGLQMIATHEIAPAGSGAQNVLLMEAKGLVAILLRPVLRRAILRALRMENSGLKKRCEEIVAQKRTGDEALQNLQSL